MTTGQHPLTVPVALQWFVLVSYFEAGVLVLMIALQYDLDAHVARLVIEFALVAKECTLVIASHRPLARFQTLVISMPCWILGHSSELMAL